jgi:hypothetical protein
VKEKLNEPGKHKYRYVDRNLTLPTDNLYARTYYYMRAQMFQLQLTHHIAKPFWIRDFVEPFEGIDEP